MKIERINDKQIRCTLTTADLISRQLKLSELAYGTDKAKSLFREMMEQAHDEVGFEAEDIPLMIEAIPLSSDSIVLIITKVDDPEELDSKLSKLSPGISGDDTADDVPSIYEKLDGADPSAPMNLVRIYSFQNLEGVIRAAHMLHLLYTGPNSLYKEPDTNDYFLVLTRNDSDAASFCKVCNMLSEYGVQNLSSGATLAFLEEHCECIISTYAIQKLSKF